MNRACGVETTEEVRIFQLELRLENEIGNFIVGGSRRADQTIGTYSSRVEIQQSRSTGSIEKCEF